MSWAERRGFVGCSGSGGPEESSVRNDAGLSNAISRGAAPALALAVVETVGEVAVGDAVVVVAGEPDLKPKPRMFLSEVVRHE